jgi:hypothetical protein
MPSVKCTYAAFVVMLWLIAIGTSLSQETPDSKSLPIPADLRSKIQLSIDLGRELYWQDKASAIGTDMLLEKLGTLEGKGLLGYLTIREGDDAGKPLPSWLVLFFTGGEPPKISYRIRIPMEQGKKPELVELPVAWEHDPTILTMFRARQTAIRALQPFDQPINPVILPASAVGQTGILVELLAGTNKPDIVVFGKHYRVLVSEDGRQVRQIMPLSKGILELNKDKNTVALFVTHIVTDYPMETHVFASMLHNIDIYVVTQRGTWLVRKDSVVLTSLDVPGKGAK